MRVGGSGPPNEIRDASCTHHPLESEGVHAGLIGVVRTRMKSFLPDVSVRGPTQVWLPDERGTCTGQREAGMVSIDKAERILVVERNAR